MPKKEYNLWIPELFSPLSIVEWLKSHMCFAKMFAPKFDLSKPNDQILLKKKGLKVKMFGFTNETKTPGDCGIQAI